MLTYQDFLAEGDKIAFCVRAISEHIGSQEYAIALDADRYDRQLNTTILEYTKMLYTLTGSPVVDFTASNNKITSNFFRLLNKQRETYLLGNGVQFEGDIKEKLGQTFDTDLQKLAYKALIHGVSFGFWNYGRLYTFPLTEFVPLWDEDTGVLMAGIRFWKLATDKPMFFVLYEIDGYTKVKDDDGNITILTEKKPYKVKVESVKAYGDEVVGGENYSSLPIVPLFGSELKQSTLVGMQRAIDSYDLIRSGFANDLTDCAQIYWIIKNAGGMKDNELMQFRDRLKLNHLAVVDSDNGGDIESHTTEIPYSARTAYLEAIRKGIYEDFGGLDVTNLSGSSKTATEINASYQPLDCMADDFEYQIIEFVQRLLGLFGIEATPTFKRNRVANQTEETQMIVSAGEYLDDETVIKHLPFISPDEVQGIIDRKAKDDLDKYGGVNANGTEEENREDTN